MILFSAGFLTKFGRAVSDNIQYISAKREPKIGQKDKLKRII